MKPILSVVVIAGYFLLLLMISFITSRKADSRSFFIGNRKSPWYLVAFGMIGASLSGITFISVPGWVITSKFYYMQMVLGYLLGYLVIIHVLLPIYYRLNLTSIYSYLRNRFGFFAYKTGAVFFLISRTIGASFRLFIVATVLQTAIFGAFFKNADLAFLISIVTTLGLIYIYTFRGGIKTIVWTDTFQTLFMLLAVILSIVFIKQALQFDFHRLISTVAHDDRSSMFNFDWKQKSFFLKQFLSGAFITIVMTGLDQDMMQKNLSCRNIGEAQKNMYWYSLLLVPVNLMFLSLGVLLAVYAQRIGLAVPGPGQTDTLFPLIATGGYLPPVVGIVFLLGLVAAAYSSADSALTSLTTSVTIDLLEAENLEENRLRKLRWKVHILMAVIIGCVIFIFRLFNNDAVISSLFVAAGYTYGPLLGMFAFGILTRKQLRNSPWILIIACAAPLLSFGVKCLIEWAIEGYKAGYEILLINGFLSFLGYTIYAMIQPVGKSSGKA